MAVGSDRRHIEIWFCDPRQCVLPASLAGLLSAQERDAMAAFRYRDSRRQYLVSHVMLRWVLSRYEPHVEPASWRFQTNDFGKPWILNPTLAPLYVNLSHISTCAAVAVSRGGEVGVDIETSSTLPDPQPLIGLCFSEAEKAHHESFAAADRGQAFIRRWTLKEAWLKALGKGLSVSPASIECTWQAGAWRIDDHHHRLSSWPGWSVHQRALREDVQLAVVAGYPSADVELKRWYPTADDGS
ncbi:4'-phosphopantetheinyl transferase superfamily protein [Salinicola endophyticus]|uniref:4'-phosphopantetheinyl transferase superfamily protein n=1 Tax=Salinicola endophyticus TaxID=1949083 RepID=A0AB74UC02_9GAMM